MLISDRWLSPSGTNEECKSLIYVENLFKIVYSLETTKTTDLFILGAHDAAKAPLVNSSAKKWERVCRQNLWCEPFFFLHSYEIFLRKKESHEQSAVSLTDRFTQALARAEAMNRISACLRLW